MNGDKNRYRAHMEVEKTCHETTGSDSNSLIIQGKKWRYKYL